MRRHFRHAVVHRPIYGFRRPIRRFGGLLGLAGMAALGYTLLEKHQRERMRMDDDQPIIWDDETNMPDPS